MIPSDEEKQQDIELLKKVIQLPIGWNIEYDVRPYLMCDIMYEIDKVKRVIKFTCYSATYPSSFLDWYVQLGIEVNSKLSKITEGVVAQC